MHYHVSRSSQEITAFRPFTHFGVAQAALERSKSAAFERAGATNPLVYEVDLALDSAFLLRVPDLVDPARQNSHGLYTLTDLLHYDVSVISSAVRDEVFRAAANSRDQDREACGFIVLAHALQDLGYEGLVYANAFEAKGQDSIVILKPEQVRIVRTLTIAELSEIAVDLSTPCEPPRRSSLSLSFW